MVDLQGVREREEDRRDRGRNNPLAVRRDLIPTAAAVKDEELLIYIHNLSGASSSSQISSLWAALHDAPYNVAILIETWLNCNVLLIFRFSMRCSGKFFDATDVTLVTREEVEAYSLRCTNH